MTQGAMEIDMSIQNTFSAQQIQFLSNKLFDVLGEDFDYNLKASKRKAALAKALGARNYDALLQRASAMTSADQEVPPLEEYYRWLKPVVIEGEQRYTAAGDPKYDEHSVSDIHFDSIEQANDEEYLEEWGFDHDHLEGLILVKVTLCQAETASAKLIYRVMQKDDAGEYEFATKEFFASSLSASDYARGIDSARKPQVVPMMQE